MATLQIVPRATTPRPSHLIRVAVPRLNKQDHIQDYLTQIPTREYDLNWAEVTETRKMIAQEWNEFVTNLLTDREWLAGKGGAGNWSDAGRANVAASQGLRSTAALYSVRTKRKRR